MEQTPQRTSEETRKRAKRAALLSGAILPGLGQFFLGQWIRGALYCVGTLGFLGYFLWKVFSGFVAYTALANMVAEIDSQVALTAPSIGTIFLKAAGFGALPAIIIWTVSAVDAYRLGMKRK